MATHPSILAWKIPGTEEPGKSQGQRSLAPYSPWHLKQLDTTEHGVAAAASNIFSSITISKAQEL